MRSKRLTKSYKSKARLKRQLEKQKSDALVFFGMSAVCATMLFFSAINLIYYQRKPEVLYKQIVLGKQDDIAKRDEFWTNILKQTPDYLPGIIELAGIKSSEGKQNEADKLIERASRINPNYPKLKAVKTSLAR